MPQYLARLKPDPRFAVAPDGSTVDLVAKDPDARAFLASSPVVTATGDVSLRQYAVDMNQLSLSACAGNATAESEEVLSSIAGFKPTPVSRLFIYNLSRNESGLLAQDDGTFIRGCFDTLSRYGVCDEYLWPYDTTKVFTLPSFMAMRQALGHRIHGYYRIQETANPQDRVDAVIAALRANHPVVFGTQVSSGFMNLTDATPQDVPTANIIGGHAMCILGYIGGNFLVKNSWGPGWGDGGFAMFKPSYIAWDQTFDLWVPTLAMNLAT